jgi:hypothetical protein
VLTQTVNPVLVSIAVSPQGLSVAVNSPGQPYTAEGTYNDSSQQDLTAYVAWTSSSTGVATISSGGIATAVAQGTTTITATLGTVAGSSTLTIYAANTFFVALNGNDTWSGDLSAPNSNDTDGPFASLSRAQYAVEQAPKPAAVIVRNGTYYPALTPTTGNTYPGTLIFNKTTDSGTSSSAQVTWQNYPGEIPVISGGVPITSDPVSGVGLHLMWTNPSGNLWQATLNPSNLTLQNFEYLYYNGQRRLRSRIHDNGTSTYPSIGYFMQNGQCVGTPSTPAGQPSPTLASCNLGTFLRVTNTIAPTDTLGGGNCPYATGTVNGVTVEKCIDRFIYTDTSGGDPIKAWTNLNGTYTGTPASPCTNTTNSYPTGDVELTLIDAWTVDVMRVSCVDTIDKVIFLLGPTKGSGTTSTTNYNFFGPTVGHRYLIENTLDAFNDAQTPSQPQYGVTGIWFLDRHATPWVLNYIANQGETPRTDNVVIPQLPLEGTQFPNGGTIPGAPATDYVGGSQIWATDLNYVTFQGITFEVDDFYPDSVGFNNDVNGEYSLPQAIDCESCQNVTFNNLTVRHTSGSGILIASSSGGAPPAATADTISGSTFYDIGDSGIRIGHTPNGKIKPIDNSLYVVNNITAQNNLIRGFSRVFADGEGIAEGNGNNNTYMNNTITDGYHAGISICFNGCGPMSGGVNVNGNGIVSKYNLISNVMQGVTSDGGSLYYNIGNGTSSGTGNVITSNVVNNTTDSYIIDNAITAGVTVHGSAYGGEGIYLDAQSADVDVENNVVFNVSGHGIHLTEGLASSSETQNTFKNNIFAFANEGMFAQDTPWPNGCPTSPILQVDVTNNIFYFDRSETSSPAFSAVGGCLDSCGQAYNTYQNFQGNSYWSTVLDFATDPNAFQVLQTQGLNPTNNSCYAPNRSHPSIPLTFDQPPTTCTWQQGAQGDTCTNSNGQSGTLPVAISEDAAGTAAYNPGFPAQGLASDTPTAYSFSINHLSQPPTPFVTGNTDDAITNAGSSLPGVGNVPPTFPNYVYGSSVNKF